MNTSTLIVLSFERNLVKQLEEATRVMEHGLQQEEPKGHWANITLAKFITNNFIEVLPNYIHLHKIGFDNYKPVVDMKITMDRKTGVNSFDIIQTCINATQKTEYQNIYHKFDTVRKQSMNMFFAIKKGGDYSLETICGIKQKVKPINNNAIVQQVVNEYLSKLPKQQAHLMRQHLQKVDNPLQYLKKLAEQ